MKLPRLKGMSSSDGWRRCFRHVFMANAVAFLSRKTASWSVTQQKTQLDCLISIKNHESLPNTKRIIKNIWRAFFWISYKKWRHPGVLVFVQRLQKIVSLDGLGRSQVPSGKGDDGCGNSLEARFLERHGNVIFQLSFFEGRAVGF